MKAMVLAAGLGTRLRPLTEDRPKALVDVGGQTMLELTLARLKHFGVDEAIVNTHHFAEMIEGYVLANGHFGMRIELSHEDELLDTGGGLKKAAWFFLEQGAKCGLDEPFLVHNVDVLSTIDLGAMVRAHRERAALATLAVMERPTSRSLLFDPDGRLLGRRKSKNGERAWAGPIQHGAAVAFCGIHVIAPRIFAEMTQEGPFSIIDTYVDLARRGERVMAFRADGAHWRDLGRPESVAKAAAEMAAGMYRD
jgi:NDP-sugar pyrophosphorylase family protein